MQDNDHLLITIMNLNKGIDCFYPTKTIFQTL